MLVSGFLGTFSLCAAGCVSQAMQVSDLEAQAQAALAPTHSAITPAPEEGAEFRIATLGAGDWLGRAIFVNDIVLAAGERKRRSDERIPDRVVVSAPLD